MGEHRISAAGDPFQAVATMHHDEEHAPCFRCLDTGWVMLTVGNDWGGLEDYLVLCRKCKGNATIRDRL